MVPRLFSYVFCSSPLQLTQGEKYSEGVRKHTEKGNEKIQIDGQAKAEISVLARWKKERQQGGEGSREEGYTFLLFFNKRTLCDLI